ncbi:hypothetical protein [Kitasatospora sp. NPDC057015]|uniref:hypothetical protein n=1 Tax=Kitasatospora sp. NPDC057015 TaxID=3346001 RepID=UPI0036368514
MLDVIWDEVITDLGSDYDTYSYVTHIGFAARNTVLCNQVGPGWNRPSGANARFRVPRQRRRDRCRRSRRAAGAGSLSVPRGVVSVAWVGVGAYTGGGEICDGEVVRTHDEAMEEEEAAQDQEGLEAGEDQGEDTEGQDEYDVSCRAVLRGA